MNAIQLLQEQHREIETLFTRFETTKAAALRRQTSKGSPTPLPRTPRSKSAIFTRR